MHEPRGRWFDAGISTIVGERLLRPGWPGRRDPARQAAARPPHGQAEVSIVEGSINGGPGLVVRVAGSTAAVATLHIDDDRIQQVWIVMNPDKLHLW